MKQIQIPERFVIAVATLLYNLNDYDLTDADRQLCDEIEGHITTKLESMKRRQVYSEYKTAAPGTDEREAKRQEYLNKAGVHKNWQTEKESLS